MCVSGVPFERKLEGKRVHMQDRRFEYPPRTVAEPSSTSKRMAFLSYTSTVRPAALSSPKLPQSSRSSPNVGSSVLATTLLCAVRSPERR